VATEPVRRAISDPEPVQDGIRTFGQGSFGRRDVLLVDLVFAGLDVQDQELAVVRAFDLGADVAIVDGFAAGGDFFRSVFRSGRGGLLRPGSRMAESLD
jgi:myo-inositol catabolism protein IolC